MTDQAWAVLRLPRTSAPYVLRASVRRTAVRPLSALTTDYSAFSNVQLSTPKPCATRYRLSMEMFCSDRSTALR